MFIDKAKIYLQGGKGGDGHISFRHEKYVEYGGPDGGNGGRGGSVYFTAKRGNNTLSAYRHAIKVHAPDGEDGHQKNSFGKAGDDVYLTVPVGTVLTMPDGKIIADLAHEGDTFLACAGGRGGKGNRCFANSVRRAPRIAENGQPGEKKTLYLELKLLADCGLVGLPSAGKSTLLAAVSNARPKTAEYAFTTLEPMLGAVRVSDSESFVMADLPGLIKGASAGRGLGFVFLRHIERCRVIIHVIDISRDYEDAFESYQIINNELGAYRLDLLKRPMLVALNKIDCDGAHERAEAFRKKLAAAGKDMSEVFEISALNKQGLKPLLRKAYDLIQTTAPFVLYKPADSEEKTYDAKGVSRLPFSVVRGEGGSYEIRGDEVLRHFSQINHDTDEGMMQLLSYLNGIGVDDELKRLGVKDGTDIVIGDFTFVYYS